MDNLLSIKKTKVVATLGPASESVEVLERMIRGGMNMARFNFSHGEYAWHEQTMHNVRTAAERVGVPVAILADLQGPRVRTHVAEPVTIAKGETIRVFDATQSDEEIARAAGDQKYITLDCPHLVPNLSVGNDILIEDGIMRLTIVDTAPHHVVCDVIDGGTIKNHKGVNIPDARIPLPTLTKKDYDDLAFALAHDVDYVALSFVRSGQDIVDARMHMRKIVGDEAAVPQIISKIECKEALTALDDILRATDAVMIARGDLGIEVEPTTIALLEKDILARSIQHVRPVIVATQMLASMEHNARPTRAEVADVTNSVVDHTDAVMLSGESSMGAFPVEAVTTMAEIAYHTEQSPYDDVSAALPLTFDSEETRIARATYDFAREVGAAGIVIFSESGYTGRMLSHFRPEQKMVVVTNKPKTYRQLALVWGVHPVLCAGDNRSKCVAHAIELAVEKEILRKGDLIITVLGTTKTGKQLRLTGSRLV